MKRVNRNDEGGFALLVIFLLAAAVAFALYQQLPRAAFESARDREQILIDRGNQYKRAIEVFYAVNKRYPAKIEDLEKTNEKRYLRHRYKDPMTGKDEWRLVHTNGTFLTDSLVQKPPQNANNGQPANQLPGGGPLGTNSMNTAQATNTTDTQQNGPDGDKAPAVNPAVNRRPSDRLFPANSPQPAVGANAPDPNANPFNPPGFNPNDPSTWPPITLAPAQNNQNGQNQLNRPPQLGGPGQLPAPQQQPAPFGPPGTQANQGNPQVFQLGPNGQPATQITPGQIPGQLPGQGGFNPQPVNGIFGNNPNNLPNQNGPNPNPQINDPSAQLTPLQQQYENQLQQYLQQQQQQQQQAQQQNQPAQQRPVGNTPPIDPAAQAGMLATVNQQLVTPNQQPATQPNPNNNNTNNGNQAGPTGGIITPNALGANNAMNSPGIAGIASKFKGPSIRKYHTRQKYQEWEFVFDPAANRPNGQVGVQPNQNPLQPGQTQPNSNPSGQNSGTNPFSQTPIFGPNNQSQPAQGQPNPQTQQQNPFTPQ